MREEARRHLAVATSMYREMDERFWLGHGPGNHATVIYWISSSARPNSDGGIVRPRALAVLRLATRTNLVGCSMGRSPCPRRPPSNGVRPRLGVAPFVQDVPGRAHTLQDAS